MVCRKCGTSFNMRRQDGPRVFCSPECTKGNRGRICEEGCSCGRHRGASFVRGRVVRESKARYRKKHRDKIREYARSDRAKQLRATWRRTPKGQAYYDRDQEHLTKLALQGFCRACRKLSDYGAYCWKCTLRREKIDEARAAKQAELDAINAELAETETLIERLEKEENCGKRDA